MSESSSTGAPRPPNADGAVDETGRSAPARKSRWWQRAPHGSTPLAADPRSPYTFDAVVLFAIPAAVALVQFWASYRMMLEVQTASLADGIQYVLQGRTFQNRYIPRSTVIERLLQWGLYPRFLSLFDLDDLGDWATATTHPKMRVIAAGQSLLLAGTTALFLFFAYGLLTGGRARRAILVALCGALLLSPLVIVWPPTILSEALLTPILILFMISCLAYDRMGPWALVGIGLACCLVALVRDALIVFVWLFAGLLGANLLVARTTRRAPVAAGLALLALAAVLGYVRTAYIDYEGRYAQTLVNVIQLRILPDPQRRAFFVARGMPTPPVVMQHAGLVAWSDNMVFAPDAELPSDYVAFRKWVLAKGNATYLKFLASHPRYLWRALFETPNLGSYPGDFRYSILDVFSTPGNIYQVHRAPYPASVRDFLLAPFGRALSLLFFLVIAARYVWRTVRRQPLSAVDVAALTGFASLLFVYHADAWDLWRHAVPFLLVIYLSMIIRIPAIAEEAVAWLRGPAASDARPRSKVDDGTSPHSNIAPTIGRTPT